jgi:hypothetical protein
MLATERARVLINQPGAQRGQRHEWFYGRAWSERVCESHVGIDDSTHAARLRVHDDDGACALAQCVGRCALQSEVRLVLGGGGRLW